MTNQTVTIVGGSGFLGRYVVRELARAGYRLRVICRDPQGAAHLKTAGDLGQIVISHGDLARPETVISQLAGSFAVVNLVGVLFESRRQRFSVLHAQGAERLAQAASMARVPNFVQISALGVEKAVSSNYARTKMLGERAVLAAFPQAVILRPSVIFGPEDDFFNRFARMAQYSPFLPLVGGGHTRFQPVYVGDVAEAVRAVLENPSSRGKVYELGGPEIMSFRRVLEYVCEVTGRNPALISLPFPLASLGAAFAEFLPSPPLTRDQVRLLKCDNIVDEGALTLASLGIRPTPASLVVPEYLARFRRAGGGQVEAA